MKLTVYGQDLEKKEILYHWISLLWNPIYNGVGSFCAEFQSAPALIGRILRGDYVVLDEDDAVMTVTSIEFTAEKFTVSGRSAESILDLRVSDAVLSPGNAEAAMRSLVGAMDPWENFALGEPLGIAAEFTESVSDGSLLKYCQRIGEMAGIGFRVTLGADASGARRLLFGCFDCGTEPVSKYSAQLGNMGEERYTESDNGYYNVAVVAGAGQGEERITVVVGDTEATGTERREIYIDARNLQPDEGETEEAYTARLIRHGEEKLAAMKRAQASEFVLAEGGVRLGDPVYVIPSYLGEPFTARITSLSIKVQNNKIVRKIGAGTPISVGRR